ncbi:MAG: hypothetical protein U1E27_12620 [Kiritimatiellia bacterium]|nr:hypothetical protein [Kiritimatiellia bacterium]
MASITETSWLESVRRERRQTGALLLGAFAGLAALLLFGLWPIRREAERLARELEQIDQKIIEAQNEVRIETTDNPHRFKRRTYPLTLAPGPLERALEAEHRRADALLEDWRGLRIRVDAFSGEKALQQVLGAPEEGRIDFKISLFNARARLAEKMARTKMKFPADLGVPDTIGATESAEERLWQLASIVRLLELCMDVGVTSVTSIQLPAPTGRPPLQENFPVQTEYPVEMRFRCEYPALIELIRRIREPGGFFGLRNVQIVQDRPGDRDLIDVSAIFHATVFRDAVRRPETEAQPPEEPEPEVPIP